MGRAACYRQPHEPLTLSLKESRMIAWHDNLQTEIGNFAPATLAALATLPTKTVAELDFSARRIALEYVRPHAGSAEAALDAVLALLRRAEAGETVQRQAWDTAYADARTSGRVAARSVKAVETAAFVARAAAQAANGDYSFATGWTARAAAYVAAGGPATAMKHAGEAKNAASDLDWNATFAAARAEIRALIEGEIEAST